MINKTTNIILNYFLTKHALIFRYSLTNHHGSIRTTERHTTYLDNNNTNAQTNRTLLCRHLVILVAGLPYEQLTLLPWKIHHFSRRPRRSPSVQSDCLLCLSVHQPHPSEYQPWARTADPPAGERRAGDALQCALQIFPIVVIVSSREINDEGFRLGEGIRLGM